MAIKFNCSNPECRQRISVDESMAGRSLRCPACGLELKVPASKNIKFNCSNRDCGQHLEVDVSEAGRFVRCPACGKPLRVPGAPQKPIVPYELLRTHKTKAELTAPAIPIHPTAPMRTAFTPFKRLLYGWGIGVVICGLVIGDLNLRAWKSLPKHFDAIADEIFFHGEILTAPTENHKGTVLLYVRTIIGGVGIFMVNLTTLTRTQIASGQAANWARSKAVRLFGWSPNDRYLAFSTILTDDENKHVFICDGHTGKIASSFITLSSLESGFWLNDNSMVLFDDLHRLFLYNLHDNNQFGQFGIKGLVLLRQLDPTASSLIPDSANSVAYIQDGNLWTLLLRDNMTIQLTHFTNCFIRPGLDYCAATDKYLFAVTNRDFVKLVLCQYDPQLMPHVTQIKGCTNYQFMARWIQNGAGIAYIGLDGKRYCLGIKFKEETSHTNLFTGPPLDSLRGYLNAYAFPEGRQLVRTIGVNPVENKIYTVASINYEPLAIWEYDVISHALRNVVSESEPLPYSHLIAPVQSSLINQEGKRVDYYYLPPAQLKANKKYPVLIDTFSDLGYQPISQFLANAGIFYVTVNPYGKGFPEQPTTPEDTVAVYNEILKNRNVDPHRIYLGGQSAGTVTVTILLENHPKLWRGAFFISPVAIENISRDTRMVPSTFFSYGIQDEIGHAIGTRKLIQQYAIEACAHHAVTQILYVHAGHTVFDIGELKKQYKAIATFILENR